MIFFYLPFNGWFQSKYWKRKYATRKLIHLNFLLSKTIGCNLDSNFKSENISPNFSLTSKLVIICNFYFRLVSGQKIWSITLSVTLDLRESFIQKDINLLMKLVKRLKKHWGEPKKKLNVLDQSDLFPNKKLMLQLIMYEPFWIRNLQIFQY